MTRTRTPRGGVVVAVMDEIDSFVPQIAAAGVAPTGVVFDVVVVAAASAIVHVYSGDEG